MEMQKWYTQGNLLKYLKEMGVAISKPTFIKLRNDGTIPQPDVRLGDKAGNSIIYAQSTADIIIEILSKRATGKGKGGKTLQA